MKFCTAILIGLVGWTWSVKAAQTEAGAGVPPHAGLETAKTICKITGVAISPLLGTGAIGAYEWIKSPAKERPHLSWYARPAFGVPALLLVGLVAAKDAAGAALPPGWKKPLDVAETIENKVSGVVAAGAVVPLITTFFPSSGASADHIVQLIDENHDLPLGLADLVHHCLKPFLELASELAPGNHARHVKGDDPLPS